MSIIYIRVNNLNNLISGSSPFSDFDAKYSESKGEKSRDQYSNFQGLNTTVKLSGLMTSVVNSIADSFKALNAFDASSMIMVKDDA